MNMGMVGSMATIITKASHAEYNRGKHDEQAKVPFDAAGRQHDKHPGEGESGTYPVQPRDGLAEEGDRHGHGHQRPRKAQRVDTAGGSTV